MFLRRAVSVPMVLVAGCTFVLDDPRPAANSAPASPNARGASAHPEAEPGRGQPVTMLAAGAAHVCALSLGGEVSCWGRNGDGQLGYGHTRTIGDDEPASAGGSVVVGGAVRSLTAGGRHTCAILVNGAIRCWGRGAELALGRGHGHTESIGDDETPASVPPAIIYGGQPRRVVAGATHSCRVTEGGLVKCWGTSLDGALGYGTGTENAGWLGEVPVGGKALDLVAGWDHTCALIDVGFPQGGVVRCWGNATAIGLGGTQNIGDDELASTAPYLPLGQVVELAAGERHSCALDAAGAVRCWGDGSDGKLGMGDTKSSPAIWGAAIALGVPAVQIAAGRDHACALTGAGRVRCWGAGRHGALGQGSTANIGDDELPAARGDVPLAERAVQVVAGDSFSCALLETGRVSCWGRGDDGQLGYGAPADVGDDELPLELAPLEPFLP